MKTRVRIPPPTELEVLIANRHACCICQNPRIQVHHIDGDPSNNLPENLATPCTDHHDLASMQLGLTKKLKPEEIRHYKKTWEEQCRNDVRALSRDRINYYVTLYKNPPRIRELFMQLSNSELRTAVESVARDLVSEHAAKISDAGFQFQVLPKVDPNTRACLVSALNRELWPSWLPRVRGHANDPDYPVDRSPPNGMQAFHQFDRYCQVLMQIILAARTPVPIEELYALKKSALIDFAAGRLITFRERVRGSRLTVPSLSSEKPTAELQIRKSRREVEYRTTMAINNMYVFSDTAASNLKNARVCGVGLLAGADSSEKNKIELRVVPLLIGMGGFGQSDSTGWVWNTK